MITANVGELFESFNVLSSFAQIFILFLMASTPDQ
jgi:hypothetical protein